MFNKKMCDMILGAYERRNGESLGDTLNGGCGCVLQNIMLSEEGYLRGA